LFPPHRTVATVTHVYRVVTLHVGLHRTFTVTVVPFTVDWLLRLRCGWLLILVYVTLPYTTFYTRCVLHCTVYTFTTRLFPFIYVDSTVTRFGYHTHVATTFTLHVYGLLFDCTLPPHVRTPRTRFVVIRLRLYTVGLHTVTVYTTHTHVRYTHAHRLVGYGYVVCYVWLRSVVYGCTRLRYVGLLRLHTFVTTVCVYYVYVYRTR